MSNYAEQLHRKLVLHSETDLIDIKDDMDDLIELADNAVDEYSDLEKEKDEKIDDLRSECNGLEDELSDAKETYDDSVTKEWGLLGEQIQEEFDEIMTNPKCNQIRFLEALRSYNQTISTNQFKSAAI